METMVQKPFIKDGKTLKSGTRVNSTGWKNEGALIATRYLRALTPDECAVPQKKAARR